MHRFHFNYYIYVLLYTLKLSVTSVTTLFLLDLRPQKNVTKSKNVTFFRPPKFNKNRNVTLVTFYLGCIYVYIYNKKGIKSPYIQL